MNILLLLIPAALLLGGLGLVGFIWAMRNNQFEDLEGAAMRILIDDEGSKPKGNQPKGSKPKGNKAKTIKPNCDSDPHHSG